MKSNRVPTPVFWLIFMPLLGAIIWFSWTVIATQNRADTVAVILPLRLTLPAGYRHERLQGMDSSVGVIHVTEPKLDIEYDASPMGVYPQGQRLLKMAKSELAAVVYFEELSLDGVPAYFLGVRIDGSANERRLFLNFPNAGAVFRVDVATPQAMAAAKAAFLRIKVAREPAK